MLAGGAVIKAMVWGKPLSGKENGMYPSALRDLGILLLRRGKESEPARQVGKEQPEKEGKVRRLQVLEAKGKECFRNEGVVKG